MAMTTEEKKQVTKESNPVYANITIRYSENDVVQYEFIKFNSIGQMNDNSSLMTFSDDDDRIFIINTNEMIRMRIDIIKDMEDLADGEQK